MELLALFKKDLLLLLRDRVGMAVLFLAPLACIVAISLALGAGDGYGIRRSNPMILLPVADYDRGPRAQALKNAVGESLRLEIQYPTAQIQALGLQDDPDCAAPDATTPVDSPACVEKVGRGLLRRWARTAVLVIPAGFSKAIDAAAPAQVTLLTSPTGDAVQIQQVEGVVRGATAGLSLQNQVRAGLNQLNDLTALAPGDLRQSLANLVSTPQPARQPPALQLARIFPQSETPAATPDTYQQTIPGYTVLFVFFLLLALTRSIRQEQQLGTFRRLLRAPASRAGLLGSKLLAAMALGLAQVFLLFGVGAMVFKLNPGSDPLAFFLLTLALVAAATGLGLAAATTGLRGVGWVAPLVIAALLGGCIFPLDRMPPFLRALSYLTPHRWALTGYQNLIVGGQGLQQVLPHIAALAGFALLFFLIAWRRFHFTKP